MLSEIGLFSEKNAESLVLISILLYGLEFSLELAIRSDIILTPIQLNHTLTERFTLSTFCVFLTLIFMLLPMANAADVGVKYTEHKQTSVNSLNETVLGEIVDSSRSADENHAGLLHFSCASCAAILSFPNNYTMALDPISNSAEFVGRFSGLISPLDLFRPPRV